MRLNWIDKTEIQFWRDDDGGRWFWMKWQSLDGGACSKRPAARDGEITLRGRMAKLQFGNLLLLLLPSDKLIKRVRWWSNIRRAAGEM